MPVFDQIQRASFDGIEFPVKSVRVRGSGRHHQHEYLRVDGAIIEKMGRGPYTFEMDAEFHATIKGYGTLWPNSLAALRNKFERQITSQLVIPTIGTVPAFLTDWDQSAEMGRIRSGEAARLQFLEDQTETFLTRALQQVDTGSVGASSAKLDAIRAELNTVLEQDVGLFEGITEAANAVLAVRDQVDLAGGLWVSRIARLVDILNQANAAITFENPVNHELLEAMKELWDAAITLKNNLADSPRGPRIHTTERETTVSAISIRLYGDTSKASELMLNNAVRDPFAVPAGERLIWFPEAA
jgi:prophage DNA circulation protein